MKKFLVFIALFLSSPLTSLACGYSPWGEDVRYSLFLPKYFNYSQYYNFYYNDFNWGVNPWRDDNQRQAAVPENILDWYAFTNKKVAIDQITDFNNRLKLTDIHPDAANEFLRFLYKNKRSDVINYLIIAKKCEDYNSYSSENVWEKEEADQVNNTAKFQVEILKAYYAEKSDYLKRKYAFQIIRFALYNGNKELIKTIFDQQFQNTSKDYLYYWSLYFKCLTADYDGKYNDIAEIFVNSPEKAFASQFFFIDNFNLKNELKFAKTNTQIANLYAYASARIVNKNLEYLKFIYQNKPKFHSLDFLVLREINKIEDWVYTPYYTNYSPSVRQGGYYESDESVVTTQTLQNRAANDRKYAAEVLDFINSCDISKVDNHVLWKAAKIQLLFITQQYDLGLEEIRKFEQHHKNEKVFTEIEKIKVLCLTAKQKLGNAILSKEVVAIVNKNRDDKRFLFALGRELEYKGNLLAGIALITLADHQNDYLEYSYDAADVEWRGNRLMNSSNLDVFHDYFDYLDFVYAAKDLQVLLNNLDKLSTENESNSIYDRLKKDKNYLIDLLGTKYIREEKLDLALQTFRSLEDNYWQENYNAWERGKFSEFMEFDQNPFYTIGYTPGFIEQKEQFFINKLSITEHLLRYLSFANDKNRKDRDYYYFLIANCYLNMTDTGNSWMMRRFNSYSTYDDTYLNQSYIDNLEYRTRVKTIHYYELAYKTSKSEKFKALCLHMIDFASNFNFKTNRVKQEYPEYYNDLSNCRSLEAFFNSRAY